MLQKLSKRFDRDVIVVGGGIVGLSAAMQLSKRFPHLSVTVVEKEASVAAHQTGHNSGVIHAGVYYLPGTRKARFCKEGSEATYSFCRKHGLPFERCGKLIVASNDLEASALEALFLRCGDNGLEPEWMNENDIRRLEPRVVGRRAILVQSSGIASYTAIAQTMSAEIESRGGEILLNSPVIGMREKADAIVVNTPARALRARFAITCAGLMADRLAQMCGLSIDFRVVPFRGEYFRLPPSKDEIVKHLIYPVPNAALPFLGVHMTRMIGGYTTVGPNAVLALAREGYTWGDVNPRDMWDMATFPGVRKLLRRHAHFAATELFKSAFRRGYLRECQKYCPELRLEDLQPHPSGVRAQLVWADGTLEHDFLILRSRRSLHVCNAPSPAATAALPIGSHIGAGGRTGRALVTALSSAGIKVRALIHREAQRELFPHPVDFEVVELGDRNSLTKGLCNVAAAYYIPPVYASREEEFGSNVIAAGIQNRIPRLIYHSVLHSATPGMPHHVRKSRVELALRESPLAWTIIQPAVYMQTPLAFLNDRHDELNPGFDAHRLFTPIDLEDLADAVTDILIQNGHEFATYELVGSETLAFVDMAAALSEVLGKTVRARAVPAQHFVDTRGAARGFGASALLDLRAMLDYYNNHGLVGNGRVLRMILKRDSTTFLESAKRELTLQAAGGASKLSRS